MMPRVIRTSAKVNATRRYLSQWATCVAPSARVNADFLAASPAQRTISRSTPLLPPPEGSSEIKLHICAPYSYILFLLNQLINLSKNPSSS